jgi:ElaA protein
VPAHSVRRSRWADLGIDDWYAIVQLRYRVFALEQRVTAQDFDGRDREPDTEHWWIDGDDGASAYLRLIRPAAEEVQPDGAEPARWVIGRVATHPDQRGQGLAHQLVGAALDAHPGDPFLLHAQEYVAGLYAKSGFRVFGEPYDEAGIRHVGMHRAG